uniref:E3 ubiquitin-protein ligase n=1 Tax=Heterorhabditis bacteriophora TaxID=37862 RepID=A0A1I7XNS4_HETBA
MSYGDDFADVRSRMQAQVLFLCLKGAAYRTSTFLCPMCRGPVDKSIFDRPTMLEVPLDMLDPEQSPSSIPNPIMQKESPCEFPLKNLDAMSSTKDSSGMGQLNLELKPVFWLYEGRHGWWRFDPRQEKDIENGLNSGMPLVEIVICGHTYIIDFVEMIQYRRDAGSAQRRAIKRVDKNEFRAMSASVKGISGDMSRTTVDLHGTIDQMDSVDPSNTMCDLLQEAFAATVSRDYENSCIQYRAVSVVRCAVASDQAFGVEDLELMDHVYSCILNTSHYDESVIEVCWEWIDALERPPRVKDPRVISSTQLSIYYAYHMLDRLDILCSWSYIVMQFADVVDEETLDLIEAAKDHAQHILATTIVVENAHQANQRVATIDRNGRDARALAEKLGRRMCASKEEPVTISLMSNEIEENAETLPTKRHKGEE